MNTIPPFLARYMKQVLCAAALINLIVFLALPIGFWNISEGQLRWYGGVFLMIFVCTHGWYRYGLYKMVLFFCITLAVAWSLESISIATGFPFGRFSYTDKLGEKIGDVPIMIFPAYFFNGYLAWTMSQIFWANGRTAATRKQLVLVPLTGAFLMVAWNACFDPIMSTLKGYWIWEGGGLYFGVPLTNFAGWFLTVYLIFQIFAFVTYRFTRHDTIVVDRYYWALIPVMFGIQGLPYLIYPFIRSQASNIYQPMAMVTVLVMIVPAFLNLMVIYKKKDRLQQVL